MGTKRICFFNTNRDWGGGEKWHYDVALQLYREGYDVLVFTAEGSPLYQRLEATGVEILSFPVTNFSFLNFGKVQALSRKLKSLHIDIIILNLSSDVKTAGIAARHAGIPRIIYRRGSAIPVRRSPLNHYLFRNVITDIIVNSRETRRTVNVGKRPLAENGKIHLFYNGLCFRQLDAIKPKSYYQKQGDEIVIGNLGRIVHQKAQHYLVDIALKLRAEGIRFIILIGGEGGLKPQLEEQIRRHKLEPYFQLVGFVDNVKGFMQSIDIYVHTALWEGFGYVIAEALYFERPVVAFRVSSNPEVIADKHTGLLAAFKDVNELYTHVRTLALSPALRKQYGKNARHYVTTHFDFQKNLEKLKRFLFC